MALRTCCPAVDPVPLVVLPRPRFEQPDRPPWRGRSGQLTLAACAHVRVQARLVWEALLFLQPGLWESPQGRQALEALVRARLEAANFAHGAAEADRKLLVSARALRGGERVGGGGEGCGKLWVGFRRRPRGGERRLDWRRGACRAGGASLP